MVEAFDRLADRLPICTANRVDKPLLDLDETLLAVHWDDPLVVALRSVALSSSASHAPCTQTFARRFATLGALGNDLLPGIIEDLSSVPSAKELADTLDRRTGKRLSQFSREAIDLWRSTSRDESSARLPQPMLLRRTIKQVRSLQRQRAMWQASWPFHAFNASYAASLGDTEALQILGKVLSDRGANVQHDGLRCAHRLLQWLQDDARCPDWCRGDVMERREVAYGVVGILANTLMIGAAAPFESPDAAQRDALEVGDGRESSPQLECNPVLCDEVEAIAEATVVHFKSLLLMFSERTRFEEAVLGGTTLLDVASDFSRLAAAHDQLSQIVDAVRGELSTPQAISKKEQLIRQLAIFRAACLIVAELATSLAPSTGRATRVSPTPAGTHRRPTRKMGSTAKPESAEGDDDEPSCGGAASLVVPTHASEVMPRAVATAALDALIPDARVTADPPTFQQTRDAIVGWQAEAAAHLAAGQAAFGVYRQAISDWTRIKDLDEAITAFGQATQRLLEVRDALTKTARQFPTLLETNERDLATCERVRALTTAFKNSAASLRPSEQVLAQLLDTRQASLMASRLVNLAPGKGSMIEIGIALVPLEVAGTSYSLPPLWAHLHLKSRTVRDTTEVSLDDFVPRAIHVKSDSKRFHAGDVDRVQLSAGFAMRMLRDAPAQAGIDPSRA